MIVVVDASTVVGAALRADSVPRRALAEVSRNHTLALSRAVLDEISEVLRRPKFRRSIPAEVADEIIGLLVASCLWVEVAVSVQACRDPGDDCYLELALAGNAAAIVSSDNDLLTLDPWCGVRIVTARQFLEDIGRPG